MQSSSRCCQKLRKRNSIQPDPASLTVALKACASVYRRAHGDASPKLSCHVCGGHIAKVFFVIARCSPHDKNI
jgi:hypothetical protein